MGRGNMTLRGPHLVLLYLGSSHGSVSAALTCLIQAVAGLHLEGHRGSYQTPGRGCPCLRLSHTHSPPPLPAPPRGLSRPGSSRSRDTLTGHSLMGRHPGPGWPEAPSRHSALEHPPGGRRRLKAGHLQPAGWSGRPPHHGHGSVLSHLLLPAWCGQHQWSLCPLASGSFHPVGARAGDRWGTRIRGVTFLPSWGGPTSRPAPHAVLTPSPPSLGTSVCPYPAGQRQPGPVQTILNPTRSGPLGP